MDITKLQLDEFLEKVASDDLSPAGGSVCALCGSLGSALAQMVCNVTVNKKGYEVYNKEILEMSKKITVIQTELLNLVEEDKKAFNKVFKVIKMSKNDKEKSLYMQDAMKGATLTPFRILELSNTALNIMENSYNITNKNSLSDLGVCATTLKASAEGSYLTIMFNLSKIKDDKFINKYKKESEYLYENSLEIANSIYAKVLENAIL